MRVRVCVHGTLNSESSILHAPLVTETAEPPVGDFASTDDRLLYWRTHRFSASWKQTPQRVAPLHATTADHTLKLKGACARRPATQSGRRVYTYAFAR